jgi:hypothetical protein
MQDLGSDEVLRSNAVKSSFILLAMLISVSGISVGRAQETIDIAKITCDQFLTGQIYDAQTFSIWLNGYYSGTRHNTVVDVSKFKSHALDIMDYCIEHKEMNLMEAIKNALGAEK